MRRNLSKTNCWRCPRGPSTQTLATMLTPWLAFPPTLAQQSMMVTDCSSRTNWPRMNLAWSWSP